MLDTAVSNGVEDNLIEGNYGIKSLLCLATSVHENGDPISSTDSLQRHLPIRVLATIKSIEEGNTKFAISFNNDPRDARDFNWKLNSFYADPESREQVEMDNVEIGASYVCRIQNLYERCRLEKMGGDQFHVYLVDTASYTVVFYGDLFYLDVKFRGGELDYGFVLSCCTPAPDFLEAVKLPTLDKFRINEVVEVIICSLLEPCLAVLGSTTKHFSRIRPETVIQGLSGEDIQTWQINFLDSDPSLNGVVCGQYPPVQPNLFDFFSLATVVAYVSLEEVHIRDILSSVRLSYLQEIINDLYGAEHCREQMKFSDRADPLPNLPCIVYDIVSRQYIRGKILRISGDRTIADVIAVDYPNVLIKGISLESVYLLSDRLNLQPQCFAVRLADIEDDEKLYHFSSMAKHFLYIGSVVSAANHDKDTLVTLKCGDDADVLEMIGYLRMLKEDEISDGSPSLLGFSNAPPMRYKRFHPVESALKRADYVPVKSSSKSFCTLEKPSHAMGSNLDALFSAECSLAPSLQKPSILKKSNYEKPKVNFPIGSIAALVSHIIDPDSIFLRTAELSESYAKLKEEMHRVMGFAQNWPISREELKVGRIYLLKGCHEGDWQRIFILKKDSTRLDVTFQNVDTGEVIEVFTDSFADQLQNRFFRAPKEIYEWKKPLVRPFCLSTKRCSEYRSNPLAIAELRKLLPDDEKVYFYDQAELEDELQSNETTTFGKCSKENPKELKMPKAKEVELFKSDGSVINDAFDHIVEKIENDEKDRKSGWV